MVLQSNLTTDMQSLRAIAQSRAREWSHFSNTAVSRVKGENTTKLQTEIFCF